MLSLLEKEKATHYSFLAWRIPGMVKPGGLPSMGSHRVRHDWSNLAAAATIAGRQDCFKSNLVVKEICLQAVFKKPVQVIKGLSIYDLRMPSCCHWTNCNVYISISKWKIKKKKKKHTHTHNGPTDFNGIVLYLGWLTVSWFFRSPSIICVCLLI